MGISPNMQQKFCFEFTGVFTNKVETIIDITYDFLDKTVNYRLIERFSAGKN